MSDTQSFPPDGKEEIEFFPVEDVEPVEVTVTVANRKYFADRDYILVVSADSAEMWLVPHELVGKLHELTISRDVLDTMPQPVPIQFDYEAVMPTQEAMQRALMLHGIIQPEDVIFIDVLKAIKAVLPKERLVARSIVRGNTHG